MEKDYKRQLHKRGKSQIETTNSEEQQGVLILIAEAQKYFEEYDYLRAAHVYRKILDLYERKKVKDSKTLGSIYIKAGQSYSQFGLFYRALEFYELYTKPFLKHLEDLDDLQHAPIFYSMAINSLMEERYFEGRDNFLKSISIWENDINHHSLDLAIAYEKLSEAFAGLKQYENAFKSLKHAKDVYERLNKKEESLCLSSYAKIYSFMGDIDKAYEYYNLYIQFSMDDKEDPRDLAWVYQNYGLILMNRNEIEESKEYLQKSQSLRKAIFRNSGGHFELGRSLISWVPLYLFKNDLDEAIKLCQEAQILNHQLYGDYHFETAEVFKYLGLICQKKAKFKEGLDYYNQVVEIKSAIFGPKHYQMADIFSLIAEAYSLNVQDSKAQSYYKKALKALKPWFGTNHIDIGNMQLLLALHEPPKNTKNIQKYLKEALNIMISCIKTSVFDTTYGFNFDNLNRVIKLDKSLVSELNECISKVTSQMDKLSDDDAQYGEYILLKLQKMNPDEKYKFSKKISTSVRTPHRFQTTLTSLKKNSSTLRELKSITNTKNFLSD